MKCLIYPNTTTNDLTENENILTSQLIGVVNLVEVLKEELGIEEATLDFKQDFDIIIASFTEDLEMLKKYNKKIIEFYYDGLNGGWFPTRVTENGVTIEDDYENTDEVIKMAGLKEYFYRIKIESNSDL